MYTFNQVFIFFLLQVEIMYPILRTPEKSCLFLLFLIPLLLLSLRLTLIKSSLPVPSALVSVFDFWLNPAVSSQLWSDFDLSEAFETIFHFLNFDIRFSSSRTAGPLQFPILIPLHFCAAQHCSL